MNSWPLPTQFQRSQLCFQQVLQRNMNISTITIEHLVNIDSNVAVKMSTTHLSPYSDIPSYYYFFDTKC